MPTRYKVTPDFVGLVRDMRAAQVQYFKLATRENPLPSRSELHIALETAKNLEKQLDRWVELYFEEAARWKAFEAGAVPAVQMTLAATVEKAEP